MTNSRNISFVKLLNFLLIFACSSSFSFNVYADINSSKKLAAKKAAIIKTLHKKATKALVNAAQDKNYVNYLEAQNPKNKDTLRKKVDQISLNVQQRFHVEEMCLIHKDGPKLARIVRNKVAYDLSPDESSAVFFAPGFSLKPRRSYISPIYMSPDADKLVLAYVTPIKALDNNEAILHYEHGLSVFQKALSKGLSDDERVIAVNQAGLVVSDSNNVIVNNKKGDSETVSDYLRPFSFAGNSLEAIKSKAESQTAIMDTEGSTYHAAYQQVKTWTIIALSK